MSDQVESVRLTDELGATMWEKYCTETGAVDLIDEVTLLSDADECFTDGGEAVIGALKEMHATGKSVRRSGKPSYGFFGNGYGYRVAPNA